MSVHGEHNNSSRCIVHSEEAGWEKKEKRRTFCPPCCLVSVETESLQNLIAREETVVVVWTALTDACRAQDWERARTD